MSTLSYKQTNNSREPLLPHSVPDGPWEKLGMDYFDFDGKKFLLLIDYFSKFMYVEEMRTSTAKATINKLKKIFSIEGSPDDKKTCLKTTTTTAAKKSVRWSDDVHITVDAETVIPPTTLNPHCTPIAQTCSVGTSCSRQH